jgi:4-hydroxybenzoate polyprenyltransferase
MKSIFHSYQIANILSLDVAAGAVVCAAFFADLFHVRILPQGLAALGLAVWIIYTTDHLMDAAKLKEHASTIRHQFHYRYFRLLSVFLFLGFCVEMILIFFLREQVFRSGIFLAVIVIVYILLSSWLKYLKEIAGALLYCSGVLLPGLSLQQQPPDSKLIPLILPFALIVLINLILFSWMDYEEDNRDKQQSIITLLGRTRGKIILTFLFFCVAIAIAISFRSLRMDVFLIYTLMAGCLMWIFLYPDLFHKNNAFRYLGDGIFLLPLIHWL